MTHYLMVKVKNLSKVEEFEAKIDSRGSVNIPAYLQRKKGYLPGSKVKIILELLEAQATNESLKSQDKEKTIHILQNKIDDGTIKKQDVTVVKLMNQGFLESDAKEIIEELVTG